MMMENLDKTAFEFLMNQVDKKLSAKGIPVMFRSLYAYGHFNPTLPYIGNYQYDNSKSPYEGRNIMETIEKWYREHYPAEKITVPPFGRRPVLIRSEVFEMTIPVVFNADPNDLDFQTHIMGLNDKLLNILTEEERSSLREQFNTYYHQASSLALLMTTITTDRNGSCFTQKTKELIVAARRDLNNACDSILSDKFDTNPWSMQQAVEKIFKALLLTKDKNLTYVKLKRQYGHNIKKLMENVSKFIPEINYLKMYLPLVDFPAHIRYEAKEFSKHDAIISLNYAHALVNINVRAFLKEVRKVDIKL